MDDELTEEQMANLPSVVLVKKKYRVGKHRRARQRRWKLRQLAVEEPDAAPTKAVERARAEEREAFYQVSYNCCLPLVGRSALFRAAARADIPEETCAGAGGGHRGAESGYIVQHRAPAP